VLITTLRLQMINQNFQITYGKITVSLTEDTALTFLDDANVPLQMKKGFRVSSLREFWLALATTQTREKTNSENDPTALRRFRKI
jgi:hypothetical protein